MSGYIFDTSVLSPLLDARHLRHGDVRTAVAALDPRSTKFVSAVVLAELEYGVRLAEIIAASASQHLQRMLARARQYAVLEVTPHTSAAYGELKANLSSYYLAKPLRKHRPRWVEDWIDQATGKRLQIDENDLWICAQAKERNLSVVTADRGMSRISTADQQVAIHLV